MEEAQLIKQNGERQLLIKQDVENELAQLLNRRGVDALLGVPDYILASYMMANLEELWHMLIAKEIHERGNNEIKQS